jgi:glycosyltransferase involved in cell wall biosynthesis
MYKPGQHILFISTLPGYDWGGSELLWSQSAIRLCEMGVKVSVSVAYRRSEPEIISQLERAGCTIVRRGAPNRLPPPAPLATRAKRWLRRKFVTIRQSESTESDLINDADLIVISQSHCIDGLPWMLTCLEASRPYVTIAQSGHFLLYHGDEMAASLEKGLNGAKTNFFVSQNNRRELENYLAVTLSNVETVWNPFQVRYDSDLPWPDDSGTLRLAQVARLYPPAKGQDILFNVLNMPKWRQRDVRVTLFGSGLNQTQVKKLALFLNLENVEFGGFSGDIQSVWREHHALLLPSRIEGLPIALVEAMLCGRPAVVTDIAGNTEVIEENVTGFVALAPSVVEFDAAMERLWQNRHRLREMGAAAASRIRSTFPEDPVGSFCERLMRRGEPSDAGSSQ